MVGLGNFIFLIFYKCLWVMPIHVGTLILMYIVQCTYNYIVRYVLLSIDGIFLALKSKPFVKQMQNLCPLFAIFAAKRDNFVPLINHGRGETYFNLTPFHSFC